MRRLRRRKPDPAGSERLRNVLGERAHWLDEWLVDVAEALREALGGAAVEVWLGAAPVLRRVASAPYVERAELALSGVEAAALANAPCLGPAWVALWLPTLQGDGAHVAALRHADTLVGMLVVRTGQLERELSVEAAAVLADAARRVGVALENERLDAALRASLEEVRESRARIVSAGEAERRRIERDLHDGAQQHLVALAVEIRLATELADTDPAAAAAVIAGLPPRVDAAIGSLRELAQGIYPPALSRGGVREALRTFALLSAIDVEIDAADVGRHPPEIESALYFCCTEAIQNAAKHAGRDARVRVRLALVDGSIEAGVSDDGIGFDDATAGAGGGLANMSDRVAAVGGELSIRSTPGTGTVIQATVPVR
jgi:signal transduction histidine kinase